MSIEKSKNKKKKEIKKNSFLSPLPSSSRLLAVNN